MPCRAGDGAMPEWPDEPPPAAAARVLHVAWAIRGKGKTECDAITEHSEWKIIVDRKIVVAQL